MKTEINNQSQNEVKDLLNEYVVSPLNTDISTSLSEISTEIESLKESTKVDIDKISQSVNGNISRLKEDVFENIKNNIDDAKDNILDEIEPLKSEIDNVNKSINNNASNLQKLLDLSSDFANKENAFEKICKSIESNQTNITDKIELLEKNTKTDINNINHSIDKNIERLQKILDYSFHFDDEEDVFENIKNSILSNREKCTSEILRTEDKLCNNILDIKTNFTESNKILNDLVKVNKNDIITNINEQIEMLEDEMSNIKDLMISRIQEIESNVKINNERLSDFAEEIQHFSDEVANQNIAINNCLKETKNTINAYELNQKKMCGKKEKKIFTISLAFGILNIVGFVAMSILILIN